MNEYKLDFAGQHKVKYILIILKVPLENFCNIRDCVVQPLEFSGT